MSPEELFESREEGPRTARMGANGQQEEGISRSAMGQGVKERKRISLKPKEVRLNRAKAWNGDLRDLPYIPAVKRERPEREGPEIEPVPYGVTEGAAAPSAAPQESSAPAAPEISAPAPAPLSTFEGLDNVNWGAGHPPDTVGDVGPNHYIQAINTSIGIYNKSTGARLAAFTFDTFMSQGNFGNLCDTDNFGDPVVLYDTFEDRWIISDFAFQLDASDNVVNPPGAFQCIAVSKTGDPVSGGWNFYSINTTGGLGDYPKFGVWPDGLYMSVNMFDYAASGTFQNPRVYAFNKAQMYAGAPSVQSVQFDAPAAEFSLLPSNARLQAGTPPAGSPNYFTVVAQFLNLISVYKLKVDWNNISTSTFTGPFDSVNTTWWAQLAAANQTAPTPANRNDELYARLMMQNQYTNIGGVESLWNSMTAGLGNPTTNTTATQSAIRYYQLKVTGGTVEATTSQAFTYSPADTTWRYMPSLAVDRGGNMAIGYSTSNATTHPTITYAGRLSTDAANSITLTDQTLIAGTGSQSGSCGGTCTRWGDYAAMSLDPDGCTFWFTSEYYQTTGLNHQTRIGSFKYPQCTPVGNGGTISGSVTANPGGAPLAGATVTLGSRTTTTDANGNYSFTIPAGTYPGMTASFPGRTTASASTIVVTDNNTTTQNFSLSAAATSGCLVDTSQADFQAGIPTNTDAATTPGSVTLATSQAVDAQSTTETQAFGFSNTSWFGQTFTPTVSGKATQVALDLFCSSCTGTPPNVVISIRNAASNLPTGADLASASIPFSNSASGGFYTATFTTPPTLTAGTQYAIVVRMAGAYATGTPAYVTSTASAYAGGRRTTSANSGVSWTGTTPDTSFKVTMNSGFKTSGDFVSSLKDANPAAGFTANWGAFSWTATTPANTTLKFQAAASNSANGPFTYVGPDGTASTFFTSGNSLSQFNGKRYLRYKAFFTSTNSAATPTINDVTVCFTDVANIATSALAASPATGSYNGTVNLSATLTASAVGVSGKSIAFTLNGNSVGSATTDGSGVATLSNVSLAGINAGSYPTGVGASFAGDSGYTSSSGTAALTVNKADQTITFNALADKTYGDADFNVSASASSGLAVSFGASGNCTVSGTSVHITGAGSCTITASQPGDSNYNAAPNVPRSCNIAKATATVSLSNLSHTYDGSPKSASVSTTPNGLSVTVTYDGSTTAPTGAGSYAVVATVTDNNYQGSASDTLTIAKANQTITFGALADKTYGDADFNVSASASSGLTVSFGATGNCSVTGTSVHITGAGSCTITASQGGDSNYNAATNIPQSFNIAKASATITLSNLTQTYDGTAKSASASTNPSGLNVVITYGTGSSAHRRNTASVTPIDAGSYTVTATIDDPNYEGSAADTLVIQKADATISVTGYTGAYDGNAHGATGTATGAQSEDLSSLLHLGATYTNVPGGTANWTFDGNTNYNPDSGSVSIDISKATPSINWSNPANITYGTALSATQLNATAATAGTFTYTPAAGTVLASGNGRNLHVDFVPTDTTNYNNASADVSINVLSAVLS
ncbi:MAG TPA: MBG domain-containing protein, partial [Pyrinomonadaceae bacterium]|nr:MBG domain-containing protein [Pyrinomonadaceae bacterium]